MFGDVFYYLGQSLGDSHQLGGFSTWCQKNPTQELLAAVNAAEWLNNLIRGQVESLKTRVEGGLKIGTAFSEDVA